MTSANKPLHSPVTMRLATLGDIEAIQTIGLLTWARAIVEAGTTSSRNPPLSGHFVRGAANDDQPQQRHEGSQTEAREV